MSQLNKVDQGDMEKYSSAISLSDMEIFVFPELMMSLVLANIMSPVIWKWREADCFKKLEGKSTYRKLMRMKQFIMDEFDFNLDLETWGLTNRQVELDRFKAFIAPQQIAQSNALFGYHGDQYYFDVDIRKHFGLDKYHSDIIPYWKTETVEAMNAFAIKESYGKPAGECVSLAALYAAGAFIVCGVPLEEIFMILTPLHSQNFLNIQGGILTNNRRIVTKAMWFNGTEISNKAQRALKNEQVTIVSHISGHIHCLYEQASINRDAYQDFALQLENYLAADLSMQMVASFLRTAPKYQRFFQVCRNCHGQAQFLKAEVLFHYEHGSKHRVGDETFDKLLAEVSDEDYIPFALPDRIRCDQLDAFLVKKKPDLRKEPDRQLLQRVIGPVIKDTQNFIADLQEFLYTKPKLPLPDKSFIKCEPVKLTPDMDQQQVINYLQGIRSGNITVDLAFYAYRDMASCDWQPFIKAAVERNPVCISKTSDMSLDQVYKWLLDMSDKSIYDKQRLAQPDEVVNFSSGDGLEKVFVMADIIKQRNPDMQITLKSADKQVTVTAQESYTFTSSKGLDIELSI